MNARFYALFFLLLAGSAAAAAPVVRLDSPKNLEYASGVVEFKFLASDLDNDSLKVSMFLEEESNGFFAKTSLQEVKNADYREHCGDPDSSTQTANSCTYSVDTRLLGNKPFKATFQASDATTTSSASTEEFLVDNEFPSVTISSPATGSWNSKDLNVEWQLAEANPDACKIIFTSDSAKVLEEAVDCLKGSHASSVQAACPTEGRDSCSIEFIAEDKAGNASTKKVAVSIDYSVPSKPLMQELSQYSSGGSVIVLWSQSKDSVSNEVVYELEVSADPGFLGPETITTASSSAQVGNLLENAKYHFRVRGVDVAGNKGEYSNSTSTLFDSAPPKLSGLAPENESSTSSFKPAISFTLVDDGSGLNPGGIQVILDSQDIFQLGSFAAGAFSYTPTLALNEGRHSLEVRARDLVGNSLIERTEFVTSIPPQNLSIQANNGEESTKEYSVTLGLRAEKAKECRYRNEDKDWSGFEPYTTQREWGLSQGGGTKTISYQCRNYFGALSETVADEIMLEQEQTGTQGSLSIANAPSSVTKGKAVTLRVITDGSIPVKDTIVYAILSSGKREQVRVDEHGNAFYLPAESGEIKFEVAKRPQIISSKGIDLQAAISAPENAVYIQGFLLVAGIAVTYYLFTKGRKERIVKTHF
ncbi:MAG TPA: hypothetical protein VJA40_05070 [archaeon]|nr:hypothetical protein [archaeon]